MCFCALLNVHAQTKVNAVSDREKIERGRSHYVNNKKSAKILGKLKGIVDELNILIIILKISENPSGTRLWGRKGVK